MLRNLLAVAWVYFFGADANYRTTDLVCLDKFGIPSDTKSLNSAYYVLQQNKNKVEDLSLFTKCTEGMPTESKLSSSDWSYRFDADSIDDSDVFCQFAVKTFSKVEHISYWFAQLAPKSIKNVNRLFFETGFTLRDIDKNKLNISWYFDKLDDGSIKDFNEVIQSKDVNLLDSEGNKLCLLNYMNKLALGSINDWSKISSNENIDTEGVVVNGHVIEKMRCKFTDWALKQAEYVLVPNLEKKDNYRGNYL